MDGREVKNANKYKNKIKVKKHKDRENVEKCKKPKRNKIFNRYFFLNIKNL